MLSASLNKTFPFLSLIKISHSTYNETSNEPPYIKTGIVSICFNTSLVREREMFYLTMYSTHFIYGYMASDIWLRTILIVRKEIRCCHTGYSYRLTARVLSYAPSHRQDNTCHNLCYTCRGALAGMRNSTPLVFT